MDGLYTSGTTRLTFSHTCNSFHVSLGDRRAALRLHASVSLRAIGRSGTRGGFQPSLKGEDETVYVLQTHADRKSSYQSCYQLSTPSYRLHLTTRRSPRGCATRHRVSVCTACGAHQHTVPNVNGGLRGLPRPSHRLLVVPSVRW